MARQPLPTFAQHAANLGNAAFVLDTGLGPHAGSQLEQRLLRAVLDGEGADVKSVRAMPAQVAAAFSPKLFYTASDSSFVDIDERNAARRSDAINRLRKSAPDYGRIATLRRLSDGASLTVWRRRQGRAPGSRWLHR